MEKYINNDRKSDADGKYIFFKYRKKGKKDLDLFSPTNAHNPEPAFSLNKNDNLEEWYIKINFMSDRTFNIFLDISSILLKKWILNYCFKKVK